MFGVFWPLVAAYGFRKRYIDSKFAAMQSATFMCAARCDMKYTWLHMDADFPTRHPCSSKQARK
jgi:hypothetical protein